MRGYLGYILCFTIYFVLHYIEGFPPVFGMPIAQLWKLPLLAYLLLLSIQSQRRKYSFEKSSYWMALQSSLNIESILNPMYSVAHAMKLLPLALFFRFWLVRFSNQIERIELYLYTLAQFVLLASLVVLLGIITPVKDFLSAKSFGLEEAVYYSAVFGAPHAASSYFAASILILLNGFISHRFKTSFEKIFNAILIVIGLISIFQAYVRTGWLMLLVGGIILMFPRRITLHHLAKFSFLIGLVGVALVYFYNTNEQFQARLTGRNVYTNAQTEGIDLKGSGRTSFWLNGIEGWSEGNVNELLLGQGYTQVVERNLEKNGIRVFSHNQFVDALSEHGLIGLVLLLAFYLSLYRLIRANRASPYYHLSLSLFCSAALFSFFQNEMYFDYAVIFSLVLVLLVKSPLKVSD
ncbi:O-antigen ligase domain-containing protein [Porphyromonas gingivalis]|nr:O-antigen ligase domain-containing protein [Porphyromonas gingivalis]SJL30764.1 ligase [Porphyromonas gingivalis]